MTAPKSIGGAYSWVWNDLPLGVMAGPPRLEWQLNGQPITDDQYGGSAVDAIYLGGNLFVDVVLQEFDNAAVQRLLESMAGGASDFGAVGAIGCDMDSMVTLNPTLSDAAAGKLLATSLGSCIPASEQYYRFMRAFIALPSRLVFSLGAELRQLPLRFQAFPFVESGTAYWFRRNAS
jgi:hypothetical protein